MSLWKYSGIFMFITGIIHTVFAVAVMNGIIAEMIADGVFNSTHLQFDREAVFWFLFGGFALLLIGQLMHYYIKHMKRPLPLGFGWALLALTVFGLVVEPISGFWLAVPQIAIIFWYGFKEKQK